MAAGDKPPPYGSYEVGRGFIPRRGGPRALHDGRERWPDVDVEPGVRRPQRRLDLLRALRAREGEAEVGVTLRQRRHLPAFRDGDDDVLHAGHGPGRLEPVDAPQ